MIFMNKKFEKVKVRTFLKKSRQDAMKDFGLSGNEYEQVLTFIKESNLVGEQMLHLYPSPAGALCISLSKTGVSAEGEGADLKTLAPTEKGMPKQAVKQTQGNYIVASWGPGSSPYVQSGTNNPALSATISVIWILGAVVGLTCQICSIVFGIQDRKAARANRDGNASSTLSN